jgi:lipopolysaccharide transport system ATP-binding protein
MAVAVKIENLSKYYRLGVINNGVLWQDLQSYVARFFNREDPNRKIGQDEVYDETGFWALSGIDLEIEQGDRLAIMGRNGAGKSTLLRILSRITVPTGGCFHVKGRIASLLEVGTGFHRELTGRENIYMNGAILGMKRREVARKLDEIIAFSEIDTHHIDTPVKRYSSGMYIRLGMAIATHLDSEILIADEALAVGDMGFMYKSIDKMKDLSVNNGRTIIFVSHSPLAVRGLCDNGIVLEHGKILMGQHPIEDVIKKYNEILGIA